jgi:hypothetical protein
MAIGESRWLFYWGALRVILSMQGNAIELRSNGQPRAAVPTFSFSILQICWQGENFMGSAIDPEAAEPSSTQGFEQSNRNPAVTNWNGTDSEGGQLATPASSESRVTQPGPAPSANAGLVDYDDLGSADDAQDEAEREG